MSNRMLVVGAATAVAGLVLGASIVLGPSPVTGGGNAVPGGIQAPDVTDPDAGKGQAGAIVTGFDYTAYEVDDKGQLRGMRLRADRADLKAMGITELKRPRAEIRLGPRRAILITADNADMQMEDSKPTAGQFTGNVVVTLLQSPAQAKLVLDPEDPAFPQSVQQRIYLDQATNFSIEDDTINTQGPVHLTSPQVDFFGIGLRLAYNTQRERIEQLLINEGRYLIYNPDAQAPGFTATNTDGPTPDDTHPNADAEHSEASGTDPHKTKPQQPTQYYAVDFFGDVLVRDGTESELAGDTLTIDFSLGTEAVTPKPISPELLNPDANHNAQLNANPDDAVHNAGLPSLLILPNHRLAQADTEAPTSAQPKTTPITAVTIPDDNRKRSLFTHDIQRDIVVTWTGKMQVLPHATKPEPLQDQDDARITLAGPNAYAQTTRNGQVERLETSRLEYLVSEERATAFARDDGTPASITSNALGGQVTGTRLILRQKAGTATVTGPGQLDYTNQDDGKTLALNWQNRLDLELYTETTANKPKTSAADPPNADAEQSEASGNNPAATDRNQTRILGIKTATFDEKVTARHTDFDLDADKLTIAFAKPNKKTDTDNTPTAINASGSVAVKARGDADDEQFDINAQRLSIELKLDKDREPYASDIRALDGVKVVRPGLDLTCNRIQVGLNPPSRSKKNPAPNTPAGGAPFASADPNPDAERSEASGTNPQHAQPPHQPYAEVHSILAIGDVRAKLDYDNRRIDLVADELIGDVENDRLTLASKDPKRPAEVFDIANNRRLTGMLVVMDDQAEQLDITGKGSLATGLDDPGNPDAGIEDAFLSVAWSDEMTFNNVTGQARFKGSVESESKRSTDASELTCDLLEMRFSPDYEHDPARLVEDAGKDDHKRYVRSAVATGNVKFNASAWDSFAPDKINNRIRLEGPRLVFTNKPALQPGQQTVETLVVQGKGRMLLEDYREPDKNKKPGDKQNDNNAADLTGRGASLFSWKDSMTLDARTNTATLLDTVQLVHIAKDEKGNAKPPVQLDCNRLVADMTDTGGLSVWMSNDAPDAQVRVITADDNVRLLQDGVRSMTGDHMKFDNNDRLVRLWTDEGKNVLIQDLKSDTTTQTNQVKWDLTTNRIEIDQLKGGVAPLE